MTREEALTILNYCDEYFHIEAEHEAFCMARNALKERPHGEWVRYTEDGFAYAKCSACKWDSGESFEYAMDRFPFCPNCGADMRGEEE